MGNPTPSASKVEKSRKRQKTGGRAPGTPNRKTTEVQKAVAASGVTPLEFMLEVMRNPLNEASDRLDAAKSAAPYVHAKLSSIDVQAEHSGEIKIEHSQRPKLSREEWLASLAR